MIYQQSDISCGAASVVNFLALYMFDPPDEKSIYHVAGTSWDGTSAKGILKALRFYKYEAKSFKASSSLGETLLSRPVICLVDNDEHWLVAFALQSGRVLVCDSAHVPVVTSLTYAEFSKRWVKGKWVEGISLC